MIHFNCYQQSEMTGNTPQTNSRHSMCVKIPEVNDKTINLKQLTDEEWTYNLFCINTHYGISYSYNFLKKITSYASMILHIFPHKLLSPSENVEYFQLWNKAQNKNFPNIFLYITTSYL